jgi:uncharacterized protein YkwD
MTIKKHVFSFVLLTSLFLLAACRAGENGQGDPTADLPTPIGQVETQPSIDTTPQVVTADPNGTGTDEISQQDVPGSIPTGPAPLTATVKMNANCRSGPGTVYQVVGGYFVEDRVDLVGISPDGAWWVVRMDENNGLCWIWGQLLELDSQARDLPVFPMPPTPVVPAAGPGDATYELLLLDLINQERAEAGVGLLSMEPRLVAAARSHSTDMAINGFFDHTGTGGTDFGQRISAQGYLYSAAGETLFAGGDAYTCIQMWLESPAHRETMLSPVFTQVGIGVFWYAESDYGIYVTADYGSP